VIEVGRDVEFIKDRAMEKILDLTMLSDIFPTGFHGAYTAGVGPGSTVYIAGAGPVGLAAAHSAQFLGAAVVIVADLIPERLEQARSFGCETIDVSKGDPKDQIEQILGVPEVDAAVDAVGFEARGHGEGSSEEAPATVLNSIMDVTRAAGKLGIPGLYVTGDPGAADEAAQEGSLSIRIGLITLDEAAQGYQDFDSGVAKEFVLNPHGLIDGASRN
jgi:glutathione-independent formaldehyde dehydrogenase